MVQTFARYTRDESEMKIQCEDMIEENMLSQLILKQLLHLTWKAVSSIPTHNNMLESYILL